MEEALRNAYNGVERGFFETIDELLVKRANLQIQIPEVRVAYSLFKKPLFVICRRFIIILAEFLIGSLCNCIRRFYGYPSVSEIIKNTHLK